MSYDIGPKIGIEGEKNFKSAVAGINKDMAVLASELGKVAAQFDGNADSMEGLAAKQKVYNSQVDEQKKKIEILKEALGNSAKEFGDADNRTKNWQISLNKAEAELAKTENALRGTTEKMDNFGKETDGTSDSLDHAGKRALSFSDILKANLLSDVIVGGIKAIGRAAVEAGKAFAGAMKDGIDYNAQMESYTASFTTMLGDEAKAQKLVNDLKAAAASTPFGMQDLASATQQLMGFGIGVEDAQKYVRQLGDVSQGDAGKFSSLTLSFAQMSATGKLMGQDLNQMINAGFNPLEEMARTTGKSIGELKEEMSIGAISADMVAAAFTSATSEGGRFYGAMEKQSQTFNGQMSTLKDNVASFKGQLADGLTDMLSGSVLPMVNSWLGGMSEAFASDGLPGLLRELDAVVQEAVVFIMEQLPSVIDTGKSFLGAIGTGILNNLDTIIDAAFQIISAIIDGLITALPKLVEKTPEIIIKIAGTLIANLPKIIEAGAKILLALVSGIVKSTPTLAKAIPGIITTVVTGLVSLPGKMLTIGGNLITSLWNGMSNKLQWLKDKIASFTSSVISSIKEFFGVHSPSTVFAEIGGNLSAGLAEGITDKASLVTSAMNRLNGQLTASASIGASGAGAGSGYGMAVSNIYMDSVLVATGTGKAQYRKNRSRARSLGVVTV